MARWLKTKLMNGFAAIASSLLRQGARSTILNPLAWMLGICGTCALVSVYIKAPLWLIVLFASFVCVTAALYLFTYVYCLVTKRETLLRSERFAIQEMAIQKGFLGDSAVGFFKIAEARSDAIEEAAEEK